jgi:hypothetical protein
MDKFVTYAEVLDQPPVHLFGVRRGCVEVGVRITTLNLSLVHYKCKHYSLIVYNIETKDIEIVQESY